MPAEIITGKQRLVVDWLEQQYQHYHRPEFIGTDPLRFVYNYESDQDREIAGLIAASLAYGNVTSINNSVGKILGMLGPSPRATMVRMSRQMIRDALAGFRHRWTSAGAMADFLVDIQSVIAEYGGLGQAFLFFDKPDQPILATLTSWVHRLRSGRVLHPKELLSDPERKSACKRLHLYLRWMIRSDQIDPGCWRGIDPSRLMIPLDTHVFGFARAAGFTRRKVPDGRAAEEITARFRRLCPEDPARYDFALTRPGIIDGWRPHKSAFKRGASLTQK